MLMVETITSVILESRCKAVKITIIMDPRNSNWCEFRGKSLCVTLKTLHVIFSTLQGSCIIG